MAYLTNHIAFWTLWINEKISATSVMLSDLCISWNALKHPIWQQPVERVFVFTTRALSRLLYVAHISHPRFLNGLTALLDITALQR